MESEKRYSFTYFTDSVLSPYQMEDFFNAYANMIVGCAKANAGLCYRATAKSLHGKRTSSVDLPPPKQSEDDCTMAEEKSVEPKIESSNSSQEEKTSSSSDASVEQQQPHNNEAASEVSNLQHTIHELPRIRGQLDLNVQLLREVAVTDSLLEFQRQMRRFDSEKAQLEREPNKKMYSSRDRYSDSLFFAAERSKSNKSFGKCGSVASTVTSIDLSRINPCSYSSNEKRLKCIDVLDELTPKDVTPIESEYPRRDRTAEEEQEQKRRNSMLYKLVCGSRKNELPRFFELEETQSRCSVSECREQKAKLAPYLTDPTVRYPTVTTVMPLTVTHYRNRSESDLNIQNLIGRIETQMVDVHSNPDKQHSDSLVNIEREIERLLTVMKADVAKLESKQDSSKRTIKTGIRVLGTSKTVCKQSPTKKPSNKKSTSCVPNGKSSARKELPEPVRAIKQCRADEGVLSDFDLESFTCSDEIEPLPRIERARVMLHYNYKMGWALITCEPQVYRHVYVHNEAKKQDTSSSTSIKKHKDHRYELILHSLYCTMFLVAYFGLTFNYACH